MYGRSLTVGVTVVCFLIAGGTGTPVDAGKVPRIAYGYEGDRNHGVFVIRADGKNRRKVSDRKAGFGGADDTYAPDWAGNGSRIAFGAMKSGISKIFTVRPDGSGQRKVSKGADCFGDNHPSWSAHSQHIVFQRDHCDPIEIWSVSRSGTDETRLSETADYEVGLGYRPQWSPDSDSIAFFRLSEDYRAEVWVMDRDGSNKRRVTSGPLHDIDPQWSPDSKKLVYTQVTAGSRFDPTKAQVCTVTVVGSTTGVTTCLTNSGAVDEDPHFSPSGGRIVFVSNRDGNRDVYVMNANGSNEERVSGRFAYDGQPEWSRDGNWIVFVSERIGGQRDLYVAHPDGTGLRRLTTTPGDEEAPTWGPPPR